MGYRIMYTVDTRYIDILGTLQKIYQDIRMSSVDNSMLTNSVCV